MLKRVMMAVALGASVPAHAAWREASSPHFVIYSQQPAEKLQAYAERLERFDALLRMMQGGKANEIRTTDRLTIYALPSQGAVERVMGRLGAAGVYHATFTGSIALTSLEDDGPQALNAQLVLLHEYTHHFMLHYHPGSYPDRLSEGYAEFLSTTRFDANGDIGVGIPASHRAYALSWTRQLMPIRTLLDTTRPDGSGNPELRAAKGWLLIHYLTFEPKRAGQLKAFLAALAKGEQPLPAATRVFGNLTQLDRDLDVYLGRSHLSYMHLASPNLAVGKIAIRELGPAENAVMLDRINTRYGVSDREAQRVVTRVREEAAPYPADVDAQCELAEAEDDARHASESEAAANRILAAHPNNFCALIFKGRAVQLRALDAHAAPDDRRWAVARAWFIKANQVDLDSAWPLALFYLDFRMAHAKPTPNAVAALLAAQNREPGDAGLRYLATLELLRQANADAARAMLLPLINEPHGKAGAALLALFNRIGHDDPAAIANDMEREAENPTKRNKG